ncbi:MAG: helix-turn-helix domain-containing protein [Alphaproteobacteria bacterium]
MPNFSKNSLLQGENNSADITSSAEHSGDAVSHRLLVAVRLKQARIEAGFSSASDFARRLGINQPTYQRHEEGERGIKGHMARLYANALGVKLSWLLTGEGAMKAEFFSRTEPYDPLMANVSSAISQSTGFFSDEPARFMGLAENKAAASWGGVQKNWPIEGFSVLMEDSECYQHVMPPEDRLHYAMVLVVQNDDAYPKYRRADLIYISPKTTQLHLGVGRDCLCWLEDGRILLKEPVASAISPRHFSLLSHNNPPLLDVPLLAIARVAWVKPKGFEDMI